MSIWAALSLGWLTMIIAMAALWLVQRRYGKAGIVDILWAAGVGVLGVMFAFLAPGYPPRRLLIGLLAGGWSLRLSLYLFTRVLSMPEDGRYEAMKQKWGEKTQSYLFAFFQVQALWSVMFAAPMLIAAGNLVAPLNWVDAAGVAVFVIAVFGESQADRQLQGFRSQPKNKGKVCRDGLWLYSRHPNYFFEWLHWWAYVLIGWQAPHGWATLFGPAIMLLFLFKVTGIPPTEENALRSRGDAYREYQRTTSVFIPLPPKSGKELPA
jgi:steroid 5-alpha reductase family enzyme